MKINDSGSFLDGDGLLEGTLGVFIVAALFGEAEIGRNIN